MKKIDIFIRTIQTKDKKVSGYGIVLKFGDYEKIIYGGRNDTEDYRIELTAVIEALEMLNELCDITVYTNSKFVKQFIKYYYLKDEYFARQKAEETNCSEQLSILFVLLNGHICQTVSFQKKTAEKYYEQCANLAIKGVLEKYYENIGLENDKKIECEDKAELFFKTFNEVDTDIYGYGIILKHNNEEKQFCEVKKSTRYRMDMRALQKGLEMLENPCNVTVYCCNKLIVETLKSRKAELWKINNWYGINNSTKKIRNTNLWEEIIKLVKKHNCKFIYVEPEDELNSEFEVCEQLFEKTFENSVDIEEEHEENSETSESEEKIYETAEKTQQIKEKSCDMCKVELFTDGACSGNPGKGGYGAILRYMGHEKEISDGEKNTTNNRMEMKALIEGLKALKEPCEVTVYSDSKYVIDSITKKWVYGWQKKGWVKSDGKPALNADLWQEILNLLEIHKCEFVWVKGHNGHPENERCDRLAVEAAAKQ